jgi:mitochondrial fission protein ELM1
VRPLKAVLITDEKPGHFHQAEGVLAAIGRLRPLDVSRVSVRRRFFIPTRMLHQLINSGAPASLILRLGYGIEPQDLPGADVVVSAGGETLAANVAAAKVLGAANIFCGRMRRVAPEHVRVIVVSLERFRSLPNHLVTLPPSPIEITRPDGGREPLGPANLPKLVGVLIGGDSGAISYKADDWQKLLSFLRRAHQSLGLRWLITTSRRSGPDVADALVALAADRASGIDKFIDYRTSGPGTLGEILTPAEAILVTADSTTMISEAIAARLPVVGMMPDGATQEEREVEYRAFLGGQGWYRALAFSELSPPRFLEVLSEITPRHTSALDELAAALAERLPQLLDPACAR